MVFLHIGLHKTGTSFLQQDVFPRWRGLNYVRPLSLPRLVLLEDGRPHLISSENLIGPLWMHQEERDAVVRRLSALFPQARILISFRRHDSFIVSYYKQYLQRGGTRPFAEFFDLEGDAGFVRRSDFLFQRKVESIEKHFGRAPFVFLQEELVRDLGALLADMGRLFGVAPPALEEVPIRRRNRGVGYYPARLLRHLNRWNRSPLNPGGPLALDNAWTRLLRIDPRTICQKWLAFLPDRPLLDEAATRGIRDCYAADWEYVCGRVRERREDLAP